jgi:hypothetical protein
MSVLVYKVVGGWNVEMSRLNKKDSGFLILANAGSVPLLFAGQGRIQNQ